MQHWNSHAGAATTSYFMQKAELFLTIAPLVHHFHEIGVFIMAILLLALPRLDGFTLTCLFLTSRVALLQNNVVAQFLKTSSSCRIYTRIHDPIPRIMYRGFVFLAHLSEKSDSISVNWAPHTAARVSLFQSAPRTTVCARICCGAP